MQTITQAGNDIPTFPNAKITEREYYELHLLMYMHTYVPFLLIDVFLLPTFNFNTNYMFFALRYEQLLKQQVYQE